MAGRYRLTTVTASPRARGSSQAGSGPRARTARVPVALSTTVATSDSATVTGPSHQTSHVTESSA